MFKLSQMHSFLWLSCIPFCTCHSFLICPSVEGHLGRFPVLAIVNGAVLNSGVRVSFPVTLFSGSAPTSDSTSPTAFSQGDYPLVFARGFGRGWSVPSTRRTPHKPVVGSYTSQFQGFCRNYWERNCSQALPLV